MVKKYEIRLPVNLFKASIADKEIVVDKLVEALGLSKAKKTHSHKKLRPGDGENRVIADLETKFYRQLWKRKELNSKILKYISDHKLLKSNISESEMRKFRKFLSDAFDLPIANITTLVMKSFLIGAMTELGEKQAAIDIATLPALIKEAIKQGKITWEQARYIGMVQMRAAENIAGISEMAQHRIRQMLINAGIEEIGHKRFAQMLFDEFNDGGLLNRDMERIAITEMNSCANAGFISGVREGEYVVGVSHADACKWCLDNIHGKVMKVIEQPPADYSTMDPDSPKYKEIAKIWDTCIWSTKSNIGRSMSKRKADGSIREHHELASPGILCHVNGRCRWVKFFPEYMYIKDGEIKYVSNEEQDAERIEWLEDHHEIKSKF